MADIQSATAEIRRGKKERKNKRQCKNMMVCQIWCPYYKKDINLIEGIQRRATKLVAGMQDFNYNDRLKMLDLQRLEERRMRSDLI